MLLKNEWGLVTHEMLHKLDKDFCFEITGVKIVPHRSYMGNLMILALEVGREAVMEVRRSLGLNNRRELYPHISVLEKSV